MYVLVKKGAFNAILITIFLLFSDYMKIENSSSSKILLLHLKKNNNNYCISININFSSLKKVPKLKLSEKFDPSHKIYGERCKLLHAVGLVATKSPSLKERLSTF